MGNKFVFDKDKKQQLWLCRRHQLKKDQCQKSLQWVYGGSIVPPLCLRCDSNTQKGMRQR
ncbi:MAG: hypothetical protein UDK36_11770 [Bacteroidaceae bacterium]|nr:hypothetical protein [Bacteroidaceae bacterium]